MKLSGKFLLSLGLAGFVCMAGGAHAAKVATSFPQTLDGVVVFVVGAVMMIGAILAEYGKKDNES